MRQGDERKERDGGRRAGDEREWRKDEWRQRKGRRLQKTRWRVVIREREGKIIGLNNIHLLERKKARTDEKKGRKI